MSSIFLNFDFYGAGNIGDDLMLQGFIDCLEGIDVSLKCYISRNSVHQKFRFPQIDFIPKEDRERKSAESSVWVGVGDTPVQIKSGDWFLKKLERDHQIRSSIGIPAYMIGIGVETEAVTEAERFSKVLSDIGFIWTRDEKSRNALIEKFGVDAAKIKSSSDLANISLSGIFPEEGLNMNRSTDLGICYYDESPDNVTLAEVKSFVDMIRKNKCRVIMFANDVNTKGMFESEIYNRMYSPLQRIFSRRIEFNLPEYFKMVRTADLVKHYSDCKTVMSSRYHALLTAAWAGCKVVAIQRSSKIRALAEELDIEEVTAPVTAEKLMEAYENAKTVRREKLEKLNRTARESVRELLVYLKTKSDPGSC